MTEKFLSVPEAALMLGLSSPTVRRLIREGTIPIVQLGGRGHAVRIRRADLDRLLEAQAVSAACDFQLRPQGRGPATAAGRL